MIESFRTAIKWTSGIVSLNSQIMIKKCSKEPNVFTFSAFGGPLLAEGPTWTLIYSPLSSSLRRRCHPAVTLCPSVSCRRRARWSACTARPAPACCCWSSLTVCGWKACCSASASACWGSTSLCELHYPGCILHPPQRTEPWVGKYLM